LRGSGRLGREEFRLDKGIRRNDHNRKHHGYYRIFFHKYYSLGDTVQADANRNFPERQIFEDRSLKTSL
jgi:hypothetical protein